MTYQSGGPIPESNWCYAHVWHVPCQVILLDNVPHDMSRCCHTWCSIFWWYGEAQKWYHRHVVNVHYACLHWTFEKVIIGLYDQSVQPSTMQDTCKEFLSTVYNSATGIQGYYDILMDHAQNMVIYPDEYQVMESSWMVSQMISGRKSLTVVYCQKSTPLMTLLHVQRPSKSPRKLWYIIVRELLWLPTHCRE